MQVWMKAHTHDHIRPLIQWLSAWLPNRTLAVLSIAQVGAKSTCSSSLGEDHRSGAQPRLKMTCLHNMKGPLHAWDITLATLPLQLVLKWTWGGCGCGSAVERSPSMCKALGSVLSTT
ncbi:hypothetical protein H1C71_028002 [Ictidomys tridecemlineatus]|nr:hypothetical protein H1C71_028002 [Ictidomys tridecemlineatus]